MFRTRTAVTVAAALALVAFGAAEYRDAQRPGCGPYDPPCVDPTRWGPLPPGITTKQMLERDRLEARYRARKTSDVARISALRELPPLRPADLAAARPRFDDLAVGAAHIRPESAREPIDGVIVAVRTDGYPCLVATAFSACFRELGPAGVAVQPSVVRSAGPTSPFDVTVAGLAADGIDRFEVLFNDGTALPVEVHHNVFEATTQREGPLPQPSVFRVNGIPYDF